AGLIQGADGNFYGTTSQGGTNGGVSGFGTVFRIGPTGGLSSLVSFNSNNGAAPEAALLQTADGLLYGTTSEGGVSNVGTVFRITTTGAFTTLFSFSGTNGANPYGGLVQASNGVLYGTTSYGGIYGNGTVFRISTNGAFQSLYTFTGGADGATPWARL